MADAPTDRQSRESRLIAQASEALGDRERAEDWMGKPNRALGGRRPTDLLDSDDGALEVEQILVRIQYGVYS